MSRYTGQVGIGDVLVTREGAWWASAAIRFGAKLRNRPSFCNHAIIIHHVDDHGTLWGIEGRPGGVGWRDLTGPLSWPETNVNNQQPKTGEQRSRIADMAVTMLGTPYDWRGIAEDTREALRLAWSIPVASEWRDDQVPGHVVCSSFADWIYENLGLANPGGGKITRMTTPGDWDAFMIGKTWDLTDDS